MSATGFIRRNHLRTPPGVIGMASRYASPSRWYEPHEAPLNKPVAVQAHDGIGPYTLPMKCMRTKDGWRHGRTLTPLHVTVVGWRYDERGVRL